MNDTNFKIRMQRAQKARFERAQKNALEFSRRDQERALEVEELKRSLFASHESEVQALESAIEAKRAIYIANAKKRFDNDIARFEHFANIEALNALNKIKRKKVKK